MLLQDWIDSKPNLVGTTVFEQLDEGGRHNYLSSCISFDGRTSEETASRSQKDRFTFGNLKLVWRRRAGDERSSTYGKRELAGFRSMAVDSRCAKTSDFPLYSWGIAEDLPRLAYSNLLPDCFSGNSCIDSQMFHIS